MKLARPSTRAFAVAPIRLAAGIAATAAAAAKGLGPQRAAAECALGALLVSFLLVVDQLRRPGIEAFAGAPPPPAEAREESLAEAVRGAVMPSTVGLTALAAASLFLNDALAAFLGGVLVGAAVAAAVFGGRVALHERLARADLLLERRQRNRRAYARPRS